MRPEVQVLPGPPVYWRHRPAPVPGSGSGPLPRRGTPLEEVPRVLRKLVFAAAAATALAAVRRRPAGRGRADLGPGGPGAPRGIGRRAPPDPAGRPRLPPRGRSSIGRAPPLQ